MSHIPYAKVPIVHQGLRQEETIVQITLALDYLEKVSCGIFQHIKTSVDKQKAHLMKLQDRSKVIEEKMDKLAGTNKATKVFASAKYPGSEIPRDLICDLLSAPVAPIDRSVVRITNKVLPYDPESLKDKCQHFHIKTSNRQVRKNIEVTPEEGLGSLPSDLDSVSALLLFNTSENLYKKYVMLDPLGVVTKTRQILEEEVKGDLVAAPSSMQQELVEFKGENYFYSPTLQEIPQLDVPLDLPDLPGIAGDLQFSMDSGPPIAPSSSTSIPDLPTVLEKTPPKATIPTPPPPPPHIPPVMTEEHVVVHIPPPPPPPPPVSKSDLTPQPPQESFPPTHSMNIVQKGGEDARANLMEAIRKAGGKDKAKLRSVIDHKQEAKRIKQEEDSIQTSSGGNLMADLHAKLSLRRKGISGAQPSVADTLEKVLASIPPLPNRESDTEEHDGDAEWDDY